MIKAVPYDSAEFLRTPAAIQHYMNEALATGDASLIAHALGTVARANSMTEIAGKTGLSRESLYRALSVDGHPEFATIVKVMKALNLQLRTITARSVATKKPAHKVKANVRKPERPLRHTTSSHHRVA
jgi:probable addiction module antidote protein